MAASISLAGQTSGWIDKPTAPYEIRVYIRGGKGWNPARDMDNCGKATFDFLVLANMIEDDSTKFVKIKHLEFEEPVTGRAAEMTVTVMEFRRHKPGEKTQQPI